MMACWFDLSDMSIQELKKRIKDCKTNIKTINMIFKDKDDKKLHLQINKDRIQRYEDTIEERILKEMNE